MAVDPGLAHYVTALFRHLPADARWTRAQRKRWLLAFVRAVDLFVETRDA